MALYAKMTYQEGYNDVLIIQEMVSRKRLIIFWIDKKNKKKFHRWSLLKNIIRRKNIYVIKKSNKKVMIFLRILIFI